jgi:hypothetical protein
MLRHQWLAGDRALTAPLIVTEAAGPHLGLSPGRNAQHTRLSSASATLGEMAEAYADWHGHVIVCGLRGVGLRIVEQLNLSGVPAVVLEDDRDPGLSRILLSWGVPRVAGSSRAADSLLGAGLEGAAAVVCVQNDDLYTLETALLIRQLRPDVRVVVQFGNPAVGRALAAAGVIVLDVAALSAPSMVEASLRSDRQEFILSGEPFEAMRTVAPRAASLRELYGALAPIAVVPADGAEVAVCPGRDFTVAAGDDARPGRPPRWRPGRPCGPDAWCCLCCTPGTAG